MAESPTAMISYSHRDHEAAELLHDEFALRGFRVIHDRYTFTEGSRIPANMANAVETCDVFVAYLTPNSLYLNGEPGASKPALNSELMPALRRRRRNLNPETIDSPVILPLAHGLGERQEANATLHAATGDNFESLWRHQPLDQTTPYIRQSEAASVADDALRSLLIKDPPAGPVSLYVTTRGSTPPPNRLTIDATRLLGEERRTGNESDWKRFWQALRGVSDILEQSTAEGEIHIHPACHLTAAFAVGRTFHQATRWQPTVDSRHGVVVPAATTTDSVLTGAPDFYAEHGDLLIDIDLLGHGVAAATDQLARSLELGGRLSLSRTTTDDLTPQNIAQAARFAADHAREARATLQPRQIHITMSVPAAFAVLFGHHMTAMGSELVMSEFDGSEYMRTLMIPHDAS